MHIKYYRKHVFVENVWPALGAICPGFNPQLRQGFLCLISCFAVVVFLVFGQNMIYGTLMKPIA